MTDIARTPLASLDGEGRLLSPVFKGPIGPAEFGFRGELALSSPKSSRTKRAPRSSSSTRS